jgi:poly-gamma-glutamate synthesis protein (capsule biosynthesis protein)
VIALPKSALALLGFALAAVCHAQDTPLRFDLTFVGDINLGRLVNTEIEQNEISPWREVLSALPRAAIQVGNLEGVVESRDGACIKPDEYCFHFSSARLDYLSAAGFTHLGLANNHALDQGSSGLLHTISALNQAGLTGGTLSGSPYLVSSKGVRYGLVFINRIASTQNTPDDLPSPRITQALDLARMNSDWVIVYIHWGSELANWAGSTQRDEAKWLIKHGADMVLGTHPHVVQPVGCIEGHPVWFSLGNHIFDQKYPSTHSGGLVACTGADSLSCKGYRTLRDGNSALLRSVNADPSLDTPGECLPHRRQKQPFQLNRISLSLSDTQTSASPSVFDLNIENAKERGMRGLPLRRISTIRLPDGELALFLLLELYSDLDRSKGIRPHVYRVSQRGILPLWRGSALAYPLIDAIPISTGKMDSLCALHARGSFLTGSQIDKQPFAMAYQWNGFGFAAIRDAEITHKCEALFEDFLSSSPNTGLQPDIGVQPAEHIVREKEYNHCE